jgi:hypothetical protein
MNYCPLEEAWGNQFQEIERYKNEQPIGQLSNFTQHHDGEFNSSNKVGEFNSSQDSDDESETYSAKFTRPKRHKRVTLDEFMALDKSRQSRQLRQKVLETSVGASTTQSVDEVDDMMTYTELQKEYIKLKREYRNLLRDYNKLKNKRSVKENFGNLNDDTNLSLNELTLLVLVGIFLIFSMNSVVQISKKLIKK